MSQEAYFYWGFCTGRFLWAATQATQKGRSWISQKFPRGPSSRSNCGTGVGPHVQVQMSNLLSGVVTRGLAATDATSGRVGARGTKLLNGLYEHQWQAGLSLPFRFATQSIRAPRAGQARKFLPREGPPAGGWGAPEKLDA